MSDYSGIKLVEWHPVIGYPDKLTVPIGWRKPRRIFVNPMSDLFHEAVPLEFVERVFGVMQQCPQHTFQVLTKRPERMAAFTLAWWGPNEDSPRGRIPLRNVWLGTSVGNQSAADERIPHLLRCPAAVRFLSLEPLLGPVGLAPMMYRGTDHAGVQWVIVGGESGPGARPCDVAWVRSIVRQCREADVPVFVKQLGSRPFQSPQCFGGTGYELPITDPKGSDPAEWPADLRVRQWPRGYKPTGDAI